HDDRYTRAAPADDAEDLFDLLPIGDGAPAELHHQHAGLSTPGAAPFTAPRPRKPRELRDRARRPAIRPSMRARDLSEPRTARDRSRRSACAARPPASDRNGSDT